MSPLDDMVDVPSHVAALDPGLQRLTQGFPRCLRHIRETRAVLLTTGCRNRFFACSQVLSVLAEGIEIQVSSQDSLQPFPSLRAHSERADNIRRDSLPLKAMTRTNVAGAWTQWECGTNG